jgi:hypothetical protein
VVRTTAGWLDKKEVVEVLFDPKVTTFAKLLAQAQCVKDPATAYVYDGEDFVVARKTLGAGAVLTKSRARPAKVSDQKYYLRQTPYGVLPLTAVQAARLNAIVGDKTSKQDPRALLSPAQRKLLDLVAARFQARRKQLAALTPARDPSKFASYTARLERVLAK